ncbi:MAG: hypothetical protein AB7O97_20165 [Planctomycetota bacterium]
MRVLIGGAGLAAHGAAIPAVLALARTRPIEAVVFDRALLRADHCAHPAYAGRGEPGLPKAVAVAAALRDGGVPAHARVGSITRWGDAEYAADLALVGLDSEAARAATHARLRAAGTPALFFGVAQAVSVHVFGGAPGDACYRCAAPGRVPFEPVPCLPNGGIGVSARRAAAPAALAILRAEVTRLALAAAAGRELGTFHAFDPASGAASARALLARHRACVADHVDGDAASAAATAVPDPHDACVRMAESATLAELFATARGDARLRGCTIRDRYLCRGCGRRDQTGADLVRAWPARERCRCGALAVDPLRRLDEITRAEAARLQLLDRSLQDLGMPAGFGAWLEPPDGAPRRRVVVTAAASRLHPAGAPS